MTPRGPVAKCVRRPKLVRIAGTAAALVALVATPLAAAGPTAGAVTITGGPSGETTETSATFTFDLGRAAEPSLTQCGLDGSTSRCSSPQSYTGLSLGRHVFTVLAFDTNGNQVGNDERIWTIVAPGPGPGPGPGPEPPPPGFEAKLSVPTTVPPSGLVTIDASPSTGAISTFEFDLDGNGSFETKCGSGSQAGAVYGKAGSQKVGVKVTAPTGETSVAQAAIAVAGIPAQPPPGTKPLPENVMTGGCIEPDATPVASVIVFLTCPKTVVLGVAEAVALSGCFQRTLIEKPETRELFVGKKAAWALVNGIRVRPDASSSVTLDATIERIYLSGQAKGSLMIFLESPFVIIESSTHTLDWNVSTPSVVGPFPGSGQSDKFLGLTVPKFSTPVSFTANRRARIPIALALPYPFKEVASGKLTLETDNTQGPIITAFKVAFGDVPLGIFEVRNAALAYARQGSDDVWSGGLTLAFPPPGSSIVAKGSLGLRNGNFDQASASFEKPTPGYGPLGCCVYMTKFGGTLKTSSIEASATLTAGPAVAGKALVSLDGSLKVYLQTFLIAAKGQISVVGIPLANGSVTLTDNGVHFLGSVDKSFAGVLKAKATVSGGLYTNGAWHALGNGSLCIDTSVKEFCAGGGVAISNKGVAGCVATSVADVGAVVYWNGGWGIFWSCSFGTLKSKVGAAYARTTAGVAAPAAEIQVRPGLTRALVRLTGAGDAPRVRVEGPDGTTFEVPGAGGDYFQDRRRFVLRLPEKRTTDIVLLRPAAGTWKLTPLPGSPRIVTVAQADPLPARIVTASLTGSGHERRLRFSSRLERGQRVSFVERGPGIEHLVGRTSKAKGELHFTVADGRAGPRRIDALVESDGIAARTETVARFRAPGPLVLPAPRLTATRTTRGLSVRWGSVPGAAAYRVRVALSDGRIVTSLSKRSRHALALPMDARTSATVSVSALSTALRDGRRARARVAALPSLAVPATVTLATLRRSRTVVVACTAPADGTCSARAIVRGRVIATGSTKVSFAHPKTMRIRLTAASLAKLHRGDVIVLSGAVPGEGVRVVRIRVR
jgi:hypothetical protein